MSPVEDAIPRSVDEPVLSILNSVVVADWVEEAISKSLRFVSPLLAWTESFAIGEVEPTPTLPYVGIERTGGVALLTPT